MAEGRKSKPPKIATIRLDDATRQRLVKELGLAGGINAIPEQIAIVAVDRQEAGYQEAELAGYAQSIGASVFVNSKLSPKLELKDLPVKVQEAAKLAGGALSTSRLTMVIPE